MTRNDHSVTLRGFQQAAVFAGPWAPSSYEGTPECFSEEIISEKQNKGSPASFLEPSFDFIVQLILLWLWQRRPALLCRVRSLSGRARGDFELGVRVFGASGGRCWGQA